MIYFTVQFVLGLFAGWKIGDLLIAAWKWKEAWRRAKRLVIPPGRHTAVVAGVHRRDNRIEIDYRLIK